MSQKEFDGWLAHYTTRPLLRNAALCRLLSLIAHAVDHPHWGIAWSGGKGGTATLTVICWLIASGRVPAPQSLTVFYADTQQELPPLAIAAAQIMAELPKRGIRASVCRH